MERDDIVKFWKDFILFVFFTLTMPLNPIIKFNENRKLAKRLKEKEKMKFSNYVP